MPGGDLIQAGLDDSLEGRESVAALLVTIGAPRLRSLGFNVPEQLVAKNPAHRLYYLLAKDGPDNAHRRINIRPLMRHPFGLPWS